MLCRSLPHHRSMMLADRIEREIDEQIEMITANDIRRFFGRTRTNLTYRRLLSKT